MLWYLRGHSWKERNKKQKNKLYIPLIIVFFIAAVLLLLQSKQKNKTISVVCVWAVGTYDNLYVSFFNFLNYISFYMNVKAGYLSQF